MVTKNIQSLFGGPGLSLDEAPIDGKPHARKDASWVEAQYSRPNLFLNASMNFGLRGIVQTNGGLIYTLDRWVSNSSAYNQVVNQNNVPECRVYNAYQQGNSTSGVYSLRQRVEARTSRQYLGQDHTLSGWVYTSDASVANLADAEVLTRLPGSQDDYSSAVSGLPWTNLNLPNVAGEWQFFEITIPANVAATSKGIEVAFRLQGGNGGTGYMLFSDWKYEPSPFATPFIRELISIEWKTLGRYFQRWGNSSASAYLNNTAANSPTAGFVVLDLVGNAVSMRVTPSMSVTSQTALNFTASFGASTAISFDSLTPVSVRMNVTYSGLGADVGKAATTRLLPNEYIFADAEIY